MVMVVGPIPKFDTDVAGGQSQITSSAMKAMPCVEHRLHLLEVGGGRHEHAAPITGSAG